MCSLCHLFSCFSVLLNAKIPSAHRPLDMNHALLLQTSPLQLLLFSFGSQCRGELWSFWRSYEVRVSQRESGLCAATVQSDDIRTMYCRQLSISGPTYVIQVSSVTSKIRHEWPWISSGSGRRNLSWLSNSADTEAAYLYHIDLN